MARNDLERILAGDSDYGGVRGGESSSRTPSFPLKRSARARISTSRALRVLDQVLPLRILAQKTAACGLRFSACGRKRCRWYSPRAP